MELNCQVFTVVKLAELLEVLTDYHANGAYEKLKANVTLLDDNDYALMVRTTNFENNDFTKSTKYINENAYNFLQKSKVYPGDLIMNKIANAGSIYLMPNLDRPVSLAMNLFLLRIDSQKANPIYIYIYLKVNEPYVKQFANGSAAKTITKEAVRNLEIKLPQRKVQDFIANLYMNLTNKIEVSAQINVILENIAQTIFKSWFIDFDPVRAKAEGRQPEGMDAETAALFPDSFEESELGMVPKGWRVKTVYELAQYVNGGAYKAFEPNEEQKGLPIVKIAELKAGITSQTKYSALDMPEKYKINNGDILFSWSGNPDTSIDVFVWTRETAWLNQHIFKVVPHDIQERAFVLMSLKYLKPVFSEIARDKQTTGLGHVTVSDLKKLKVTMPPEEVFNKWNVIVEPLLEKILIGDLQTQTLISLRDKLLQGLISGKIHIEE